MQSQPMTWKKIGLAILPGILALGQELTSHLFWQYRILHNSTFTWIFNLVCLGLCVAGFVRERKVTRWSLPALGILLAHIPLMSSRLFEFAGLTTWPFTVYLFEILYAIMAIAAGAYFARDHGMAAGLVFVGMLYVFWEGIGDPEYALGMFTDNQLLVTLVAISAQLAFLILVPVFVLRSATTKAQFLGYFIPLSVGMLYAEAVASRIRPYNSFARSLSIDLIVVLLPLLIVLGLCIRISQHTTSVNASEA